MKDNNMTDKTRGSWSHPECEGKKLSLSYFRKGQYKYIYIYVSGSRSQHFFTYVCHDQTLKRISNGFKLQVRRRIEKKKKGPGRERKVKWKFLVELEAA